MNKEKISVVVGGGPVGMLAALLCQKKFGGKVYLLDQANSLGGLLSSIQLNNHWFDFGTHFLSLTNDDKLNSLLYGNNINSEFQKFDYLKTCQYFMGKWDNKSHLINAHHLSEKRYTQGLKEFFDSFEYPDQTCPIPGQLENYYGKTFAKLIYTPLLKKIYHVDDVSILDNDALSLFSLGRIKILQKEISKLMKTLPCFDKKIGFHNCWEGIGHKYTYIYPKNRGCIAWIEKIEQRLKENNVIILKGQKIEKIEILKNRIEKITISLSKTINPDHLIWTAPLFFLHNLIKKNVATNLPEIELRNSILTHVVLRKNYPTDAYYGYCYDQDYISFRLTFYNNFRNFGKNNHKLLTIESIVKNFQEEKDFISIIKKEMRLMNLIDSDDDIISMKVNYIPKTFPVFANNYRFKCLQYKKNIENTINNLKILGKSSGESFTLLGLLENAYKEINQISKELD